MRCGAVARKILHLVGTVLVIIPVVIFIVVVFGFGGLMAAIEGWTFSDGAKYIGQTITGLGNPLTDIDPDTTGGIIVANLMCIWAIGISGIVIGTFGSGSMFNAFVDWLEGKCKRFTRFYSALALVVFLTLVTPVVVLPCAGLLGALLAEIEGWSIADGYLYVISNLTGLGNPLTDATPDTDAGIYFALLVSIWSLTIAGAAISILGNFDCMSTLANLAEGDYSDCEAMGAEAATSTDEVDAVGAILINHARPVAGQRTVGSFAVPSDANTSTTDDVGDEDESDDELDMDNLDAGDVDDDGMALTI